MKQNLGGPHLLLEDSETVVGAEASVWMHVRQRPGDQWDRPGRATDDHLHVMAVCMESWLLADRDALSRFVGPNFQTAQLPKAIGLETVDKDTIFNALHAATRNTTKGCYAKGKLSFAALAATDVNVVRSKMPFCDRFVTRLLCEGGAQPA